MVSPLIAARAYAAVQGAAKPPGPAAASPDEGMDFGQMVSKAVTDMATTSRVAEAKAAAHLQGKADLVDVVTSITSAQTSLQTMMAVRDQVIQAYQSIMNMPI